MMNMSKLLLKPMVEGSEQNHSYYKPSSKKLSGQVEHQLVKNILMLRLTFKTLNFKTD